MRSTPFLQSPAGIALRCALTLGLLGWLAARVPWTDFAGLRQLDWPLAAAALLLAGLAYPLQIWRWQQLIRAQGFAVPAREVQVASWAGFFYNSFLPGGIAGDAVRFTLLRRHAPDRKTAAAAGLLADRLIGLAALLGLAALMLGLHLAQNGGGRDHRLLLGSFLVLLVGTLLGAAILRRRAWWTPLASRLLGAERTGILVEAIAPLSHGRVALPALLISLLVWLVDFASLWLLARSVGLAAGFLGLSAAAAAAYVVAALPISIGGHGLREGTLVAMLALLGIGTGQSAQVALLAVAFLVVSVGWSLFGGLVTLLAPAQPTPAPAP